MKESRRGERREREPGVSDPTICHRGLVASGTRQRLRTRHHLANPPPMPDSFGAKPNASAGNIGGYGSLRLERDEEGHDRKNPQRRSDRVKDIPSYDQSTALRTCILQPSRHERFVGRHNSENGPRPIRNQQQRSGEECDSAGQPPRYGPQDEADDRKWSLHSKSTLVV